MSTLFTPAFVIGYVTVGNGTVIFVQHKDEMISITVTSSLMLFMTCIIRRSYRNRIWEKDGQKNEWTGLKEC